MPVMPVQLVAHIVLLNVQLRLKPVFNVIHHSAKEPEAPSDLRETNSGSTEVALEWTKPNVPTKEGLSYTVSAVDLFSIFDENSEGIPETLCIF